MIIPLLVLLVGIDTCVGVIGDETFDVAVCRRVGLATGSTAASKQ